MAYTVVSGDTLSGIAKKLGVSLSALEQANSQIKNFNVIAPGQQINTPGGAAAPAANNGSSVTLQQASDQYSQLAQVLWNIPDLRGLLQQGVTAGWSPAYFQAQFQASNWYQQHSDTARQWLMTQAADPKAWQQQLNNTAEHVTLVANTLGRTVDANSVATQMLMGGWSEQQLTDYVGANGGFQQGANGAYVGTAAQYATKLKQLSQDYNIPVTDSWVQQAAGAIEAGKDTIDGYTQQLLQQAKAKFPQFSAQLDAGQTVAQIADPYMAQMAKTLELPQSSITVDNPAIQRALSQNDPKTGQATSLPMWQFDQQLKQDPRYANTEGARNDAVSLIHTIGKDFGYLT